MIEKIKENRFARLLLLTGAVYFFLKVIAPLAAPVLTAMLFVTIFGPLLLKMQKKLRIHRQIGAAAASSGLWLSGGAAVGAVLLDDIQSARAGEVAGFAGTGIVRFHT